MLDLCCSSSSYSHQHSWIMKHIRFINIVMSVLHVNCMKYSSCKIHWMSAKSGCSCAYSDHDIYNNIVSAVDKQRIICPMWLECDLRSFACQRQICVFCTICLIGPYIDYFIISQTIYIDDNFRALSKLYGAVCYCSFSLLLYKSKEMKSHLATA